MNTDSRQFARFALVGALGFVVDTVILYIAMGWLSLGLYTGRGVSYLCAATFTWAANRSFTFAAAPLAPAAKQWLKFLIANILGAMVNYGTYAAMVSYLPIVAAWPVLGVACGSLFGLAFNFAVSRAWVFKGST